MKINEHKIAFVICTNNQTFCKECLYYISNLNVPDGYEIDVITIEGAEYITKAYNAAIKDSDAKYKVYLHQDVFIVNPDFISDVLEIFEDKKVGMIGLAGITTLRSFFANGYTWNKGSLYVNDIGDAFRIHFGDVQGLYDKVQAIDGMMMITQYDLPWRDDIFQGWDYYDISQSMVFLQNGYDIVVPNTEKVWIMHDHGVLNYKNYDHWKAVFLEEYGAYVESIAANNDDKFVQLEEVVEKIKQLYEENDVENAKKLIFRARKVSSLYNDIIAIYDANILLNEGDGEQAWNVIRRGLEYNPRNYELYVLLGEYYLQKNANQAYLCFENALLHCDNEEDSAQIQNFMDELKETQEITVNKTSFIILSYNTLEYTRTCIESIRENTLSSSREIVVVDNASTDGSLDWLKKQEDIVLRANKENSGFPKGCNQGVEVASKENDVFLLNNDTLLPPNALFWLRMGLYESDKVGATGSVTNCAANFQSIPFENESTDNLLKYAMKNNVPRKYPYEEKLHLIGFALLIKRSVYDEVGDLDERFSPGNYEDNDYGVRVLKAGYKNVLCKNSFILHFGSKSFGKKAEAYTKLLATNAQKFSDKWKLEDNIYFEPHPYLINQIAENAEAPIRVLDIGCACGATSAFLKGRYPNAETYGVEINPYAADIAQHLTNIICADIETLDCPWEEEYFDYIILGNVLEDLKDPAGTLKKLYPYLRKGGQIIVSVPNMKHYSVLLPLIACDDATVSKKYTAAEILLLVKECGYVPKQILPVCLGEPEGEIDDMVNQLVQMSISKDKTTFLTYQYLLKAGKE